MNLEFSTAPGVTIIFRGQMHWRFRTFSRGKMFTKNSDFDIMHYGPIDFPSVRSVPLSAKVAHFRVDFLPRISRISRMGNGFVSSVKSVKSVVELFGLRLCAPGHPWYPPLRLGRLGRAVSFAVREKMISDVRGGRRRPISAGVARTLRTYGKSAGPQNRSTHAVPLSENPGPSQVPGALRR
jgi:hypothetical protein